MRHFKSFDLNFERLFCSFKRKQFDLNCFTQGFSLKTDIHKKFESILFLKLQKVESEIRFENPLCFELNFKKSKMYSVTLQSVILKTLLNHFILKHFENDSKVFLKWVVWKRPIEIKKTIWVVLFQILFERCSKCFQDILQKFENFGSKVCNNLHLETEHFWLWIRIKFDFKTKFEKKRFELISKVYF